MKNALKSRTIWLNVVACIVAVLGVLDQQLLGGVIKNPQALATTLAIIGAVTTVLNIILRFATTQAITLKKNK